MRNVYGKVFQNILTRDVEYFYMILNKIIMM